MKVLIAFVVVLLAAISAFTSSTLSARASAQPVLFADCTPDTIRPNTEAVFSCSISITNDGDAPATDLMVSGTLAPDHNAPTVEIFDFYVNGAFVPISQYAIGFPVPNLDPHGTYDAEVRLILGVRDPGAYGFQLNLLAGGTTVDSAIISVDATEESPYPPTDMQITKTLVATSSTPQEGSFPPSAEQATYDIAIKNVSGQVLQAVVLRDRLSPNARIITSDPQAAWIDTQADLAQWDLGSLGPDEELTVHVTLGAVACTLSIDVVTVWAEAPGMHEDYVARADRGVTLGTDCPPGQGGGGPTPTSISPVVLPGSGMGTASATSWWPASALLLAAVALSAGAGAIAAARRRA